MICQTLLEVVTRYIELDYISLEHIFCQYNMLVIKSWSIQTEQRIPSSGLVNYVQLGNKTDTQTFILS